MKNLFNRATQRIYEAFNGPKLKDPEFDEKVSEMHASEKGMNMLRSVFLNCDKNIQGLKNHFGEVTNSIKCIYKGASSYDAVSNDLISAHENMEEQISQFSKAMNDVRNMTEEWVNLFRDAKAAIEKREADRREYEHYDQKMEDIMKERAGKSSETPKEIDFYQRNEDKFRNACENFVNSSLVAYQKIDLILEKKFNLINPSIIFLLEREKELFSGLTKIILKLDGLNSKFNACSKQRGSGKPPYDPSRYVRGEFMIKKPELDKEKNVYTYKDWVDRQRGGTLTETPKTFTSMDVLGKDIEQLKVSSNMSNIVTEKVDKQDSKPKFEVDKSVYNPYEDINDLSVRNTTNYGMMQSINNQSQIPNRSNVINYGNNMSNINNVNNMNNMNNIGSFPSNVPSSIQNPNQNTMNMGYGGNVNSNVNNFSQFSNYQNQFSNQNVNQSMYQMNPNNPNFSQMKNQNQMQNQGSPNVNQSDFYSYSNYPKK